MNHTDSAPCIKMSRQRIRTAYQHDPDRGSTAFTAFEFKTGETIGRELPTPEFLARMKDIANCCRVEVVRQ